MKILFVLHDMSLTGAPKLGMQIAEAFAQKHEVILVSKKDGPLNALLNRDLISRIIVTNTSHELGDTPVDDRIESAKALINQVAPDLVYVNSFAAAEWVSAGVDTGTKVVLHTHEMKTEITSLLSRRIFRPESIAKADYVVGASEECLMDAINIFRLDTNRTENFGVCVDVELIQALAAKDESPPVRHDGTHLTFKHITVVMCGLACTRKGTDIFYEIAAKHPDKDFLWVGPWNDEIAEKVNPALALNLKSPLENLYWTNTTRNPYAYLAKADLFILTSREDPNPLVVPEALLLGIPTVTFAGTGGSHSWTRRFSFALSGPISIERSALFVDNFFKQGQYELSPTYYFELIPVLDLKKKTANLAATLEDIFTCMPKVHVT